MAVSGTDQQVFDIVFVAQRGRLQYEGLILVASLRAAMPDHGGTLYCLEPQKGALWPDDPTISDRDVRTLLDEMGVVFVPFESAQFGAAYPQGNKIEGLTALPEGRAFLFLDTDTLILDDLRDVPFDFSRPGASLRREPTWPKTSLYGPGLTATWKALYDAFDLTFETALDTRWPDGFWRRYPYYNAGFFFGACPVRFGRRFTDFACTIRDEGPEEIRCQVLYPWLDQIALPLVIHSFGGGPDALSPGYMDGSHHCHYRTLPLLYAREAPDVIATLERVVAPNRVKKVLKRHEPALRMIYQGRGAKARALFDQSALPRKEQAIRNTLRRNGFWMR